ncbi:MAG: hypothetical protein LBQ42_13850, partial [Synergistaceae bacterium]|nr:hypothetical protein [Synergistaceae bacterium]
RINWDNGYEHNRKNIGAGVYINSKDKPKDYEEIVADQPYPVTIRYWVDGGYLLTPRYKSATIAVNGLLTEFKDVPVAP